MQLPFQTPMIGLHPLVSGELSAEPDGSSAGMHDFSLDLGDPVPPPIPQVQVAADEMAKPLETDPDVLAGSRLDEAPLRLTAAELDPEVPTKLGAPAAQGPVAVTPDLVVRQDSVQIISHEIPLRSSEGQNLGEEPSVLLPRRDQAEVFVAPKNASLVAPAGETRLPQLFALDPAETVETSHKQISRAVGQAASPLPLPDGPRAPATPFVGRRIESSGSAVAPGPLGKSPQHFEDLGGNHLQKTGSGNKGADSQVSARPSASASTADNLTRSPAMRLGPVAAAEPSSPPVKAVDHSSRPVSGDRVFKLSDPQPTTASPAVPHQKSDGKIEVGTMTLKEQSKPTEQAMDPPLSSPAKPAPHHMELPTKATPKTPTSERLVEHHISHAPKAAATLPQLPVDQVKTDITPMAQSSSGIDGAPFPELAPLRDTSTSSSRPTRLAEFPTSAPQAQSVILQVKTALQPMGGTQGSIEIVLKPEELGRLQMSFSPSEAGGAVNILVERPETLDLMQRHLEALRRELREAGWSQAEIVLKQDGQDKGDRAFNENASQQPEQSPNPKPRAADTEAHVALEPTALGQRGGSGALDIRM